MMCQFSLSSRVHLSIRHRLPILSDSWRELNLLKGESNIQISTADSGLLFPIRKMTKTSGDSLWYMLENAFEDACYYFFLKGGRGGLKVDVWFYMSTLYDDG